MKTFIIVLTVLFCISPVVPQAKKDAKNVAPQTSPASKSNEGMIWGQTFVDYSYAAQSEDASQKGTNAFEFRRIYLGYDQNISDQFSARVLIEADKEDTAKSGAMDFTAEEAYLEWKNLVSLSSIYFGLSYTPSIAMAEKIWGYRSLEKVILDRNGLVAYDDMGVAIKGKFVSDGSIGYAVMVGNGQGVKLENDKLKKIYGELYCTPMKNGVVELYSDYENSPDAQWKLTGKGLLGYQVPSVSAGVEGFYRIVHDGAFNTLTPTDSNLAGGSAYTSFQITDGIRGVLREDFYDANVSETNVGIRESFSIIGLDYSPALGVHVIPNVLYTHRLYKVSPAHGPALVDDITARLTFAYSFSARVQ
ncbi:MAG: hypothetical protein WBW71_14370 [Bacteroidota bacterium]